MLTTDTPSSQFPLLVEALRLLPGISPRQERDRLGEAKYLASHSPTLITDFNGVELTVTRLQELFVRDKQGRPRVSPEGATLLLHLYEERAFPSFGDRRVAGDLELLTQYSRGLATVIGPNYWRGVRRKTPCTSANVAQPKELGGQILGVTHPREAPITGVPAIMFRSSIHRLS